jgi:hypothetical protein
MESLYHLQIIVSVLMQVANAKVSCNHWSLDLLICKEIRASPAGRRIWSAHVQTGPTTLKGNGSSLYPLWSSHHPRKKLQHVLISSWANLRWQST